MNEHIDIILEALQDYRNWFDNWDKHPTENDKFKCEQIDAAIKYLESL